MSNTFDVTRLDATSMSELCRHYEEEGYCILTGLEHQVTRRFYPVVADTLGVGADDFREFLNPESSDRVFPETLRQKVSRISTPPALAAGLLDALQPVLLPLIGPLAHVSTNFHAQFKCGDMGRIGHGGYDSSYSYMEVHGPYQLHQDFTGANLPTSPSAMTLWVGLNECPDWPVRLYPRSHRLGLFCQQFVPLNHERLSRLSEPVDFQSRPGTALIFNALVLHGTGFGGPRRRVSCDIRFFPLCGYLPTRTHALTESPRMFIEEALAGNPGPFRRAPLLEDLIYSGSRIEPQDAPQGSVLNWANYLNELCYGSPDRAVGHLERFTNSEVGLEGPDAYISRLHGRPMQAETLGRARELMALESATAAGRS